MAHRDGPLQPVRYGDARAVHRARAFVGRGALVELAADADDAALGIVRRRAILPSRNLWLVESASAQSEDGLALAARLQRRVEFGASVKQALPDLYFPRRAHAPANDPRFAGQWFLQRIGIEAAWDLQRGSADVTVVVIDNGCDLQHPDLVNKLDQGKDVIDGDDDPSYAPNANGNNHGTACAGLVGASTDNQLGVAGVCPNCRVRCVRLLPDDPMGLVPISADADAFAFALSVNAAVTSNSWGFTEAIAVPEMLKDAIATVRRDGRGGLGMLVVFAAGNDDRELLDEELNAVPGVITVGAVNNFGEVAQFSNFGKSVAVVAPLGTLTTDISGADGSDPGDYTSLFGGTSSACPLVAGLFGLMVSAAPTKTAAELEQVLLDTAVQSIFATPDPMGHDLYYGYGEIDAHAALTVLQPPVPPKKKGCAIGDGPLDPSLLLVVAWLLARRRRRGRA